MTSAPDLGQQLDRQLAAVAFRYRLQHDELRLRPGLGSPGRARSARARRAGPPSTMHSAIVAGTVSDVGALAGRQPPDRAGVPAFLAAQDVSRSAARSAAAATKTGGLRTAQPWTQRPLKASRSREKNPCWPGANLPGGASSPRSLASCRSSSSCSGSSLARGLDGDVDDQVAAARAVQPLGPLPVHRDGVPGLGAWPDVKLGGPVQRLHLKRRAERGRHHRDRHRAVQVIALALEYRMRPLDDLQEQVTGRTAARPGLAFAGQLDMRAVLDARPGCAP